MCASTDRYGSDITCTWPASGKFSPQQRVVYCAVLAAHTAVIAAMRPGVAWPVGFSRCGPQSAVLLCLPCAFA